MRIIGIDPSLSSTGVTVLDTDLDSLIADQFTIATKPAMGDSRLTMIRYSLEATLRDYEPRLAVLESLPFNARSAGQTGMAQGVIRQLLEEHVIPVVFVVPSTLKKFATGSGAVPKGAKGKARKEPMLAAFAELNGYRVEDDNQVDAHFLALMGCAALQDKGKMHGVQHMIDTMKGTSWGADLLDEAEEDMCLPLAYPSPQS